ncbi:hypothetical protein D3C77_596900 [compost metagenome]
MGKHAENIWIGEHFFIIIQPYPGLLRAIAVPIGEAEPNQLERRIIGEEQQEGDRY